MSDAGEEKDEEDAEETEPEDQGPDDRPALKSAIAALARQLAVLHASSNVVLKTPGSSKVYKCRREVVATWSPPFETLMKETAEDEVQIDAPPELLEDALRFMLQGRLPSLPSDESGNLSDQSEERRHSLLSFADTWQLEDLKSTYGEMMMARERLSAQNAASYLQLGLKHSVANISLAAADILAKSIDVKNGAVAHVIALDAACMQAILASDELHVEDEAESLELIQRWAAVDKQRLHDVPGLLMQVRLSLCSFQCLIDLVSNLSKDPWKEVDAKRLSAKVRTVVDEKLAAVTSDRMRHFTKLPDPEQERKLAATLQASKSLYAV
ncbi:klhl40 [Symbiodinium sp. CCMP2592]|nr:klhl40 [Symbiodinium sp. CCMP2592]